jgi:MoaA/NifB/PqqE/SkfB family radical SAM enzyme
MIEIDAITNKLNEAFMVTWDMLRRCNLDCTYCESTRHNNYSNYPTLEELKITFDFIKSYTELYNSKKIFNSHTNIDFTGGEPTANPNFWPLIDYIKQYDNFNLGLTTNGTWGKNFTQKILDNFSHITISWHAEASNHLKERSIKNIKSLYDAGKSVQANIMMHCDYFNEAASLCEDLRNYGIKKVSPVPIGDGTIIRKGWFIDSEGKNRRIGHEYSVEQQEWFYKFKGIDYSARQCKDGAEMGRSCCGGRCLIGKSNGEWQDVSHVKNHFKDWHCMINWFFMHIEQHTGNIFHHQTCQATFDGKGPIGNLNDSNEILKKLKDTLSQNTVPSIVCPNQRCGCGMCIPKAKYSEDFKKLWNQSVIEIKPIL